MLFIDDFDVLTDTPILTFPLRGGRDLFSPLTATRTSVLPRDEYVRPALPEGRW